MPQTSNVTVPFPLKDLPTSVPVLISGGGPSGLMMALDLAKRGIRTTIVEPRLQVDPFRPRAKTTNARTMTLLRQLGLADRLREVAALDVGYSEDVAFCTALNGYELRRFRHAFQLYEEGFPHAPEIGQQVQQPVVEELLREAVAQEPLVTCAFGLRVTSVQNPDDPEVTVEFAAEGGADDARSVRVRADYVIGADGGSSAVRRSLGIGYTGTSAPRPNFNVVFRSHELGKRVTLQPAVQFWVVGEVSGMIGQLDREGLWWSIVQGVDPEECTDPEGLVRQLAGVGEDIDIEVLGTDPWTAKMLLADAYSQGRVHLVGDAAHLNPPFGGHGFNTCVLDALNLSWKLATVLRGDAAPALLDSYAAERRPAARRMIDVAAHNTKHLAYTFNDEALTADGAVGEAARARAHEKLAVKAAEFHAEGLVLGYNYHDSPLHLPREYEEAPAEADPVTYSPVCAPGYLLPHLWLAGGTAVYDVLGTDFTLLGLIDTGALLEEARVLPNTVAVVSIPARDRVAARNLWGSDFVLVRPDQMVLWQGEDIRGAAEALRHVTHQTHGVAA